MKMRIYGVLDVDEIALDGMRVYPNPTEGIITVYKSEFRIMNSEFRITNVMGQTLITGQVAGESQQIDVSGLPKGLYFISIDGMTRKFVRN